MRTVVVISIILCAAACAVCVDVMGAKESLYDAHGKRDPFVPLIGIDRGPVGSLDGVMSIEDVRLEGIAMGGQGKMIAILNGEMVKEGLVSGLLQVKSITPKKVVISVGGKEGTLTLPEEGGSKGEK